MNLFHGRARLNRKATNIALLVALGCVAIDTEAPACGRKLGGESEAAWCDVLGRMESTPATFVSVSLPGQGR